MRTLVVAAIALATASPVSAQVEPGLVLGGVFEIETSERMTGERQIPALVPWTTDRTLLRLDSVRSDGSSLRLWLAPNTVQSLEVELRPDGRFLGGSFNDVLRARYPDARIDSLSFEYQRLRGRGGQVSLQELRAWDLIPTLPTEVGMAAAWRDTLFASASRDGHVEEWTGVRSYEVVGDTTLNGRTHWRLREVAELSLQSVVLTRDRSFEDFRTRSQSLRGSLVGYSIIDAESHRIHSRIDTLTVAGPQEVALPDGRAFSSGVRWERTRRVTHRAADGAQARDDSVRTATRYGRARVGGLPVSLSTRLDGRDPLLIDSLVAVARDGDSAEDRLEALELLQRSLGYLQHTPAWRDALLSIGDTAQALQAAVAGTIDDDDIRLVGPYLEDPARLHAHGLRSEQLLTSVRAGLQRSPPSIPTVLWDGGPEACTPSACSVIAAWAENETDTRLADLGLFARFAIDPAQWADAYTERTSPFLDRTKSLLSAIGVNASGTPIPAPGADVEEWAAWMDWPTDTARSLPQWPYETTHSIRFAEQLQDRDIVGELRERYQGATDERSRLVFGFPLSHLEGDFFAADEIGAQLRAGFAADEELLRWHLFRPNGAPLAWEPAPEADVRSLLSDAHEVFIGGESRWDLEYEFGGWFPGGYDEPLFALTEEVPPDVAGRWSERISFVDADAFEAERNELREHVMLRWHPVLAFGDLRRLTLSYVQFVAIDLPNGPELIQNFVHYSVVVVRDGEGWRSVGLSFGRGH